MFVVPPRWTVEPTDANVASGQDVMLHCQADGYPVPSIMWRKAVGMCTAKKNTSFQNKIKEKLFLNNFYIFNFIRDQGFNG